MTTVATTEIATIATPSSAMMTYNIRLLLLLLLLLLLDEAVLSCASAVLVGGDVVGVSVVETSALGLRPAVDSGTSPRDCCCELVDPSVVTVEEIVELSVRVLDVDALVEVVVDDDVLVDVIAVLVLVSVGRKLVVVVSSRGS